MASKRVSMIVEREIESVAHPRNSRARLQGICLKVGDVIQPSDFYSSSDGSWQQAPSPCQGMVLQKTSDDLIWIRPCAE